VFVEDADQKAALAEIYRANLAAYRELPRPEYDDGDARGERMEFVRVSSDYLAQHLHHVPVLLLPCLEGRVEQAPLLSSSFWASLFPGRVELHAGAALAGTGLDVDHTASAR
jgi:hypothetical protein